MTDNIVKVNYSEEMKNSYLQYALEVVSNRALPDVRDGLKPVQRRILYAVNDLGLVNSKPYKKCARIVGEVLGKYHPHGDSSVYEALVRMAQDWSLRYPLIDGHGNFGSIDGDSAAAMRYTEAKMTKLNEEMLRDINKNTVDFIPNFDSEENEPSVLPSRIPNLLVNGSSGVAVGMVTEIPPHNIGDTIDTVIYQIDNPNCNIEDLVNIIKAPDFPTGGIIINPNDVKDIYLNGRGKVIIRGKYHIENNTIVFTEIPYKVDKSKLLDTIAMLKEERITYKKGKNGKMIEDKKLNPIIPQILDVVDESDKNGMRICIHIKKGSSIDDILFLLFKNTNLQSDINTYFTVIKDCVPVEHMNLKDINSNYIVHQKDIITRRTTFDLDKILARKHILEGFLIALGSIDKVIALIRSSQDKKEAKSKLLNHFNLSEQQSTAILEMRLQKLTSLEIDDIKDEYSKATKTALELKEILDDDSKLLNVLKSELIKIKETYGDNRKTELKEISTHNNKKIAQDYNCRIVYTKNFIKKVLIKTNTHKFKEGEIILDDLRSNNKDTLFFITNKANRYKILVDDLGEPLKPSNIGDKISNIIDLEPEEEVIKIVSIPEEPKGYIVSVFENGYIAKIDINSFLSANKKLANCYSLNSKLIDLQYIDKDCNILLISSEGKGLIIDTSKLNSKKGKSSNGVGGIKLEDNLTCIGCIIDVNKNHNITLKTTKNEDIYHMLDDISVNENKSWFEYLKGSPNRQGNFIHNCRNKNYSISKLIY